MGRYLLDRLVERKETRKIVTGLVVSDPSKWIKYGFLKRYYEFIGKIVF